MRVSQHATPKNPQKSLMNSDCSMGGMSCGSQVHGLDFRRSNSKCQEETAFLRIPTHAQLGYGPTHTVKPRHQTKPKREHNSHNFSTLNRSVHHQPEEKRRHSNKSNTYIALFLFGPRNPFQVRTGTSNTRRNKGAKT